MLKIEIRPAREGACPSCEDTGIVLPKKRDGQVEVGTFCHDCQAGADRWERTLEIMSVADKPSMRGPNRMDRPAGARPPSSGTSSPIIR